jgi:hypothetical protein
LLGAEFESFTAQRDGGTTQPGDGSSALRDGRSTSDVSNDVDAANDSDAGSAVADTSSPPPEGSTGCTPGEVHEIATCASCGRYRQICNAQGVWDPPFCQEPPDACAPSTTEQRSCEGDGTQTATCTPSCTWSLGACLHSVCMPTQIEKQPCGSCGTQSRACQATDGGWTWTPFSACMDEKDCAPEQVERESCGRCGTHFRSCNLQCAWGSWQACEDEGDCVPGDTQERGCLIGLLKQTRTCSDRCAWGDWIGLCL